MKKDHIALIGIQRCPYCDAWRPTTCPFAKPGCGAFKKTCATGGGGKTLQAFIAHATAHPGKGPEPESNSPAQASRFVDAEMHQSGAVVKAADIKAD